MKKVIKKITPPFIIDLAKSVIAQQQWIGDYPNFETALKATSGYDAEAILQRVIEAQNLVLEGKAAFERDSVPFMKSEVPFPLLTALLLSSANRTMNVLDFGGSLGSHFYQAKPYLEGYEIHWGVVEQPRFVQEGKKRFETKNLRFFAEINEAVHALGPLNLIVSSSTLQYLNEPYFWLEALLAQNCKYLFFDRIGFNTEHYDRLTIQRVPAEIYPASYPCWFFNEDRFKKMILKNHRIIFEHACQDQADIPSYYRGFMIEKNA